MMRSTPIEKCKRFELGTLTLADYTSILCDTAVTLRYFEGGVSSVYLWDLEDGGFAGAVVLKKGQFPTVLVFRPFSFFS